MRTFLLHLAVLLIGVSKVGFGGGAGMVATPLLALVFPPREALGLTLPLLLATDVMALWLYRGQWDGRQVRALLPGALLGIAVAAPVLRQLPPGALARVIGGLVLFVTLIPWRRFVRTKGLPESAPRPALGFAAGLAAGFSSMLAHAGGLFTTLYLLPQRLPNAVFVATGTVLFFCMNTAKLIPYAADGLVSGHTLARDLALLPTLAIGVGLGFRLNRKVNPEAFNRVVLLALILMGLKLLRDGG